MHNMILEKKQKGKPDSHIMGQIPVRVQSQVFSTYSRVMLSSFIETWYLGEGQLWQSLAGVTSTALPALEANAGLAKEFQRVQHPEDHLGPHQHLSALRQSPDMGGSLPHIKGEETPGHPQPSLLLIQDLQVGFFQLFCFDDTPAREKKISQSSK